MIEIEQPPGRRIGEACLAEVAPMRGDDEKRTGDRERYPRDDVLAVPSLSCGICAAASQTPAKSTSKNPTSATRMPV